MCEQLLDKIENAKRLLDAINLEVDAREDSSNLYAFACGDLFAIHKIVERLAVGGGSVDQSAVQELSALLDELWRALTRECRIDFESALAFSQRFGSVTQALIDSYRDVSS